MKSPLVKKNLVKSPLVKNTRAISLLIAVLLLAACSNGVEVTAKFDQAQNIEEGAQVYYKGNVVGNVKRHTKEPQGSAVVMSLDEAAAKIIAPNSAVVINHIKPGSPLEIHASVNPAQGGVSHGQELVGMNSTFDLIAWSVGDTFKSTTTELSTYVNEFSNYLESDQFKNDKAQVEQGVAEMANSAAQAIQSIEQDLASAMADIDVSEEDLAKAIEGLGNDLSPLAKEMAKSGTNLMQELDKFTQGLENATPAEQASGQRLIESMLAAIERLNKSAGEGVKESLEETQ